MPSRSEEARTRHPTTPWIRSSFPVPRTRAFNAGLNAILTQLSALPGISIARLDAYTLLNDIVADPESYGLTNTGEPCVTPFDEPFFCQPADEYLFWDGIHPTRAAHTIVGQAAASVLGR